MEEMVRRANYLGQKYLLTNLKIDIKSTLRADGILRTYGISAPRFDTVKKFYFDTPDMFFRKNGINISLNEYSTKGYSDIIVRYDSTQERIAFISNLPDTFIKKIRKTDKIDKHYDYMATAILELVPKGLHADIFEVIKLIRPILQVTKKRQRYRIINNNGLKMVFSFEKNLYKSLTHKQSIKLQTLEVRLESPQIKTEQLFAEFLHKLHLQEAMFIKLEKSDLFIGQEYLDI